MKKIGTTLVFILFFLSTQAQPLKKPVIKPTVNVAPKKIKYVIELVELYTTKSYDGVYWDGIVRRDDLEEELYGAISVCMAANGYPGATQLDYTYKNAVDKEITGGVEPSPQSTNPNGRVLWRQSDGKYDRRINISTMNKKYVKIGTKSVFIFDPSKDPQAVFRFFADMWESDPSDDDEHFNAGARRISVPISEITVGEAKFYTLQIYDSSSRHHASIKITAEYVQ